MTLLQQIASKIPAHYRKTILEDNKISKAKVGNDDMLYLAVIWIDYIEHTDINCPICLSRILENFQGMQATLVEMEKESKLLNEV